MEMLKVKWSHRVGTWYLQLNCDLVRTDLNYFPLFHLLCFEGLGRKQPSLRQERLSPKTELASAWAMDMPAFVTVRTFCLWYLGLKGQPKHTKNINSFLLNDWWQQIYKLPLFISPLLSSSLSPKLSSYLSVYAGKAGYIISTSLCSLSKQGIQSGIPELICKLLTNIILAPQCAK